MENISRRQFLDKSAVGITAAGCMAGAALPLNANLEMPLDLMKPSVPYLKSLKV